MITTDHWLIYHVETFSGKNMRLKLNAVFLRKINATVDGCNQQATGAENTTLFANQIRALFFLTTNLLTF